MPKPGQARPAQLLESMALVGVTLELEGQDKQWDRDKASQEYATIVLHSPAHRAAWLENKVASGGRGHQGVCEEGQRQLTMTSMR